jgi:hypothetical protein
MRRARHPHLKRFARYGLLGIAMKILVNHDRVNLADTAGMSILGPEKNLKQTRKSLLNPIDETV